MTRKEYINLIAPLAIESCRSTGLYPSCLIAQACVESNNGNSSLSKVANNHFGIKADKSWKGRVWSANTREVINGKDVYIKDGFRYYNSIEEGFVDRNKFLKTNSRYTKAGVFDTKTPQGQAFYFEKAGYATDPNYAEVISQVIDANNLEQYDAGFEKDRALYVDATGLRLRKEPSTDAVIIMTLGKGAKLMLIEGNSEWALVWSPNAKQFGYVSSDYLITKYTL